MGHQVVGALLTGAVALASVIALASAVFGGEEFEGARGDGIALFLIGTVVMGAIAIVRSELGGLIAGPQDAVASVLAVALADLASGGADPLADSAIALIIVVTAATGVTLYLLGRFGLGRLIRFVPFPVMAGFLGGVGLALAWSAIGLVLDPFPREDLLGGDAVAVWLPAVVLGALLSAASHRPRIDRIALPGLLVLSMVGSAAFRALSGLDRQELTDRGWLIAGVPDGSLLKLDALTSLPEADWFAVASQFGTVSSILVLVPLASLLHTGGFEESFSIDLDADRELRDAGVGNAAACLVGGPAGYAKFAPTVISRRTSGGGLGPQLGVLAGAIAMLLAGGTVISLAPRWVLGGVLLSIAYSFIWKWLIEVKGKVELTSWLTIVGIAVSIVVFGFLFGILLGLGLTAGTFIVRYSRIPSVYSDLTLTHRRSNVQRPPHEEEQLKELGNRILVMELQGYVFFGSAEGLLAPLRRHLDDPTARLEGVVIDFRRTSGIDSSATTSFAKLIRLATEHRIELIMCSLDEADRGPVLAGVAEGVPGSVAFRTDLDHALEDAETHLLSRHGVREPDHGGFAAAFGPSTDALRQYFERLEVQEGHTLLRQGEPSPGLLVLDAGTASVWIEGESGVARSRRLRAGSIVGDITAYLGGGCTATVQMDEAGVVYLLSPEQRRALEQATPDVAITLHTAMAQTLAERLVYSNAVIDELLG